MRYRGSVTRMGSGAMLSRGGPAEIVVARMEQSEIRENRARHPRMALRSIRATPCTSQFSRKQSGYFPPRATTRDKANNDERKPMEPGYFAMPSHPPECGLKEGHDFDLQVLRWLDELGYQEAWIGEHHTAPWEPHPAPDLLVAQAFLQTKNIRLGPGGFLLPYHHPAELANRVAMLDHLSGGRLNFGVAASGLPSDWAMFNVDGMSGQNRDMTREALEIILKMWTEDAPWTYTGKFWTVTKPETMFEFLK